METGRITKQWRGGTRKTDQFRFCGPVRLEHFAGVAVLSGSHAHHLSRHNRLLLTGEREREREREKKKERKKKSINGEVRQQGIINSIQFTNT